MAVEILAPLGLALAALAYYRRCATLDGRGQPVPLWRRLSFARARPAAGGGRPASGLDLAEELVVAHMAQHLLIADLAALLVCLGLTGPLLQPLLALRGLGWLRAFGNPLVALPVWVLNLYLWHLGVLYQGVLDERRCSTSLSTPASSASAWRCGWRCWARCRSRLVQRPAKLGYVVAVRFSGAVLGNVLIWSGTVLYPDYAPGEREWGISPLADQGAAGMVMMIETGVVTLGLFAWLFFRGARRGARSSSCSTSPTRDGVALDEARAARAVAAGQGQAREAAPASHRPLSATPSGSSRRTSSAEAPATATSTCWSSWSARPASAPRSPRRA